MKIFLIGFMGSGKTSLGKRLSKRLGLKFIDLDQAIENKFQITIQKMFEVFGETTFRNIETTTLQTIIEKDNSFVLSCGGGTPCFSSNIDLINKSGISIYIKMDEKALMSRLQKSPKKRPLLNNLSDNELLQRISLVMKERDKFYSQAQLTINGINVNIDQIVDMLKENYST
jgi:shikimate kinase